MAGLRSEWQVFVCMKSQAMAQFMLYEDGRGTRHLCMHTLPLWGRVSDVHFTILHAMLLPASEGEHHV